MQCNSIIQSTIQYSTVLHCLIHITRRTAEFRRISVCSVASRFSYFFLFSHHSSIYRSFLPTLHIFNNVIVLVHTILRNGCNCSYLGFFFCAWILLFFSYAHEWAGERVNASASVTICVYYYSRLMYTVLYTYRITDWHKQIYMESICEKNTANFIARAFHIQHMLEY